MDNLFKFDPLIWWKNKADKYLDSWHSIGTLWGNWRLEEFQRYARARPLSQEDMTYFFNHRINLIFSNKIELFTICPTYKPNSLFDITLGFPESKRGVALVHEIVHGFYRYRGKFGGRLESNPEERAVEAVAKRFYHRNQEFVEEILKSRIITNHQ